MATITPPPLPSSWGRSEGKVNDWFRLSEFLSSYTPFLLLFLSCIVWHFCIFCIAVDESCVLCGDHQLLNIGVIGRLWCGGNDPHPRGTKNQNKTWWWGETLLPSPRFVLQSRQLNPSFDFFPAHQGTSYTVIYRRQKKDIWYTEVNYIQYIPHPHFFFFFATSDATTQWGIDFQRQTSENEETLWCNEIQQLWGGSVANSPQLRDQLVIPSMLPSAFFSPPCHGWSCRRGRRTDAQPVSEQNGKTQKTKILSEQMPHWSTPNHLLLDSAPNLGPLISRWEINKFKNCRYKSARILEVLKLLFQQFLNLSSSQRDRSGPESLSKMALGRLFSTVTSWSTKHGLAFKEDSQRWGQPSQRKLCWVGCRGWGRFLLRICYGRWARDWTVSTSSNIRIVQY